MANPKSIMMKAMRYEQEEEKGEAYGGDAAAIKSLISKVFATRNLTHFAHWNTKSYAKHMALGDLYDGIVGQVDEIVECYQGKHGLLDGLSTGIATVPQDIVAHVQDEQAWVAENRDKISSGCEAVGALVDNLDAAYLKALYKLKNLS